MLSPQPVVQNHALLHIPSEDKAATEKIILKHCIPKHVVGAERDNLKATLSTNFWEEHGECVLFVLFFYFIL